MERWKRSGGEICPSFFTSIFFLPLSRGECLADKVQLSCSGAGVLESSRGFWERRFAFRGLSSIDFGFL